MTAGQTTQFSSTRDVTKPSARGYQTLRAEDYAIRGLALMTILNVNNVIYMVTGLRQVGSIVILVLALGVLVSCWRFLRSTPFSLFVAMIATYLLCGWYFSAAEPDEQAKSYPLAYVATLIIVWAFASYIIKRSPTGDHVRVLRFIRMALLIATGSIWITPLLLPLWNYLPLSEGEQRYSGFFSNPNEAGFVAAHALAFVLMLPMRSRVLSVALGAFCFVGVVLSFSKTATILAGIILLLGLMHHLKLRRAVLVAPFVVGVFVAFLSSPADIFYAAADQKFVEFTPTQQERLNEIGELISGRFDERTTTNRTDLWAYGLERIAEHFPSGAGFGSYHHMVGGAIAGESWLGIHNTPLMVLGEGGLLPFILLVAVVLILVWRWRLGQSSFLEISLFIVLLGDLMSNHSALEVRYANVILGVVFALSTLAKVRSDPSAQGGYPFAVTA